MGITDGTRKAYEIQTISTWSALVTDEWYVFIQHFPMTLKTITQTLSTAQSIHGFSCFHLIARWGKNALHFHIVELLMTIISDTNEKRTDAYTNSLLCKRII